MNLKELISAVHQVAEEKGIETKRAVEAVEQALAAAYKKECRKRSEVVRARLNQKNGELKFSLVKTVVDPSEVRVVEDVPEEAGVEGQKKQTPEIDMSGEEGEGVLPRYNSDRHIFVEDAKEFKKDAVSGDEIEFPLESHEDFGRIAAQTAKQVILQALREAEKDSIRKEFAGKEGEVVSGVVQRFERGSVYADLGRVIGVMFHNESILGEHYKVGQRMRFLVLAVQDEDRKRPGIILSRAHPNFVQKLFEMEVPEVAEGIVEIKFVAREPGNRTKIAVSSNQEGVDPIGAVVGQRGTRVMAVTNELGNEKVDVIQWSEEPAKFVGNAISPAKVKLVEILPRREARVLVAEDQLSLAIGKFGQNVRLAAKLTGWKIDVRSQSRPDEVLEGGIAQAQIDLVDPALAGHGAGADETQTNAGDSKENAGSSDEESEDSQEK